jgi:hypothetical protein
MQREFKQDLIRMRIPWRVVRSVEEFVALLDQLERQHLDSDAVTPPPLRVHREAYLRGYADGRASVTRGTT